MGAGQQAGRLSLVAVLVLLWSSFATPAEFIGVGTGFSQADHGRKALSSVSGVQVRMEEVYWQRSGKGSPVSGNGSVEHPCANVVRSHALHMHAKPDSDCVLLTTGKAAVKEEAGFEAPCFSELWLSAKKLSVLARRKSVPERVSLVLELRINQTDVLGAVVINLGESQASDFHWVKIDITTVYDRFRRINAVSNYHRQRGLRICTVGRSSGKKLPYTRQKLATARDKHVQQKPFIVSGYYHKLRGIDEFMREHADYLAKPAIRLAMLADAHRKRRSIVNNQIIELAQQHTKPTTATSSPTQPVTVTTAEQAETDNGTSSSNEPAQVRPCRRVPLHVSLASLTPFFDSVVFPTSLELFDCVGYCTKEVPEASVHALLMREVRKRRRLSPDLQSPGCCIPTAFKREPLVLMVKNSDTGALAVHGDLRNPQVTKCGCT